MTLNELNIIIDLGFYLAFSVWILLAIILGYFLIKKDWRKLKSCLKFLINSIVFLFAWYFILDLALIVRTTILETKAESIKYLDHWISIKVENYLITSAIVVLVLFFFNLFYQLKIEKVKNNLILILLLVTDATVLVSSTFISGKYSYLSLLNEIELNF